MINLHQRCILLTMVLIFVAVVLGEEDSPEPHSRPIDCTKCPQTNASARTSSGVLRDEPSQTDSEGDAHSRAPTDLPVKKIWVHGRPVYVRQVFVEPLRPGVGSARNDGDRSRHKRSGGQGCPHIRREMPDNLQCFAGIGSEAWRRGKRTGSPVGSANAGGSSTQVAIPPYYSPAYAQRAQVALYPPQPKSSPTVQQFSYPQAQRTAQLQHHHQPPVNVYVESFEQPPPAPQPQLPPLMQTQLLLPAPRPVPQLVVPAAISVEQPALQPVDSYLPLEDYPLPECYTGDSGFMCCNAALEESMKRAFQELVSSIPNFHRGNTQKIANVVQRRAEERFKGHTFEVVVGLSDYASQSHFHGNLICKIERDSRFILAYASPVAEPSSPLHKPPPHYPRHPQHSDQNSGAGGRRNHSYVWRARK